MKLNFYRSLCFLLLFYAGLQGLAQSNIHRKDAWITDGGLEKVQYANGYTMLSGDYSQAGSYTGTAAFGSIKTNTATAGMPIVNGDINVSLPDGNGGWYIGGSFALIDTVKVSNLAHINADKTVDRSWKPTPDGTVYAMALNANVLYLGGYFQNVQKQTRNYLAAVSTIDGKLTTWNPNCDGVVNALAVSGSTVYAGGYFTKVGGVARNKIAAISTADTGIPTAWNANITGYNVKAIIATPTVVYACGSFTAVGGSSRNNLGAMNVTTGAVTSWNPPVIATGDVNTMLLSGTTLYVGGYFTMKGSTAVNLAAINATTGAQLLGFIPQFDYVPSTLAISGGTLYVGGSFSQVNTETRNNFAAIKTSDGSLLPFDCSPHGSVATLTVDGDNIFIGGYFNGINWEDHLTFVLLEEATDKPWPFTFDIDGSVKTIAIKDNVLYIGGEFTTVNKQTRHGLAAFELGTGKLLPWAPVLNGFFNASFGYVNDMVIKDNTLYVGGYFGSIDKATRINLAGIDLATGAAAKFDISAGNGYFDVVNELDLFGNTLYVAGTFSNSLPDNAARTNLEAIDVSTNKLLPWAPVCNGQVSHIKVNATTAYVVGDFGNGVGGVIRDHKIAALDITSGKATDWNPNFNNVTSDVALTSTDVYVSGYYTTIDTTKLAGGLASFSLATGKLNAWRPDVRGNSDGSPGIQSLSTSSKRLHAGGNFEYVGDKYARARITNYVEYALCSDAFDLTLKNSTLTSAAAGGYQWYVDGKPIDGATSQTLEINIAEYGVYYVMITLNNCTGRSHDYVNLITGQEVTSVNGLIRVFPNPSKEEFFIEVAEQSTLTMFNVMGQPVRTSNLQAEQTNRIETHGLTSGTYVLVVRSSSKTNYLKIIKSY